MTRFEQHVCRLLIDSLSTRRHETHKSPAGMSVNRCIRLLDEAIERGKLGLRNSVPLGSEVDNLESLITNAMELIGATKPSP